MRRMPSQIPEDPLRAKWRRLHARIPGTARSGGIIGAWEGCVVRSGMQARKDFLRWRTRSGSSPGY
jgi:hypothetical protein